jgi:predicted metal-dependent phosphoesterase TrpH
MRLARVPWIALVTTLLVLVSALFRVPPIRDAATLEPVEGASLTHSPGYLAGAPFFDALDTLSLLTVGQHVALLLTAFAVYAAWRIVHRRRKAAVAAGAGREVGARRSRHPALREVAFAPLLLLGLLAVYAVNAVVRRPMAALELRELDVVAVDIHSHTKYSHDGRSRWDAEDVREWHSASGFNAAYITDHRNYRGAEEGVANNPATAGQGTVLLSGLEVVYRGERVNVLSAGRVYRGLTTPNLWDIDTTALAMASLVARREPVVIQTFPGSFDRITPAQGPGTPGVRAIELVDGAPRGLSQTRRERRRIVRLADSLNLALVAGSNNHGWGRTAPGWTLFRIPGWRGMSPDQLATTIESAIREGGRRATRVVERRAAETDHPALLALTVPLTVWRMLTMLSSDQRVMWIVWAWALALAWRAVRKRFGPRGARLPSGQGGTREPNGERGARTRAR